MPNLKSAIKRVKTNEKRRVRNAAVKSVLRTAVKNFEATVEAGNAEEAKTAFAEATKRIDKAASKGVIHKNTAARQKSKLAKKLNGLSS